MKPVILDTGAIVAALDESEQHHRQVRAALDGISAPLITCEAVIAESCYLLRTIPKAVDAILRNVEQQTFLLPFTLSEYANRVSRLMKKYSDQPMGLADACLVCLAENFQTPHILTLDADFQVYRYGRNQRFNLL
jgi:predicted nucleic acid-binding protein